MLLKLWKWLQKDPPPFQVDCLNSVQRSSSALHSSAEDTSSNPNRSNHHLLRLLLYPAERSWLATPEYSTMGVSCASAQNSRASWDFLCCSPPSPKVKLQLFYCFVIQIFICRVYVKVQVALVYCSGIDPTLNTAIQEDKFHFNLCHRIFFVLQLLHLLWKSSKTQNVL